MLEPKPDASDVTAFASWPVDLAGQQLVADMSGALYWPAERALIVADLHLEKGSAFAARGVMLPPYDTRETLAALACVLAHWPVETVVALGDSLHDVRAPERMGARELAMVHAMQQGRRWIWITGNHDPEIVSSLGGECVERYTLQGIEMRHVPEPAVSRASGQLAGHLHPAARFTAHGRTVRRRCFVSDGSTLVLPAFGAFAGGLNIHDEAFTDLFDDSELTVLMLGDDGVYPIPPRLLGPD